MSLLSISDDNKHFLKLLLTPSWLSGLIMVLVGLTMSVGIIVVLSFNGSSLKQYLISWEHNRNFSNSSVQGQTNETINPTLKNSWPLIFVWGVVGLFTYAVAAAVIKFILETIEFRKEMNYVHANPRSMMVVTIEHIITRIVAAGLLVILGLKYGERILAYSISAGSISSKHISSVTGIRYIIEVFLLNVVAIYIATILLRLMFGKARLGKNT
ncbi:MAG: hypothetical protein ACHQT9_02930 [Candidatus Saccharimonadales bacterium]